MGFLFWTHIRLTRAEPQLVSEAVGVTHGGLPSTPRPNFWRADLNIDPTDGLQPALASSKFASRSSLDPDVAYHARTEEGFCYQVGGTFCVDGVAGQQPFSYN